MRKHGRCEGAHHVHTCVSAETVPGMGPFPHGASPRRRWGGTFCGSAPQLPQGARCGAGQDSESNTARTLNDFTDTARSPRRERHSAMGAGHAIIAAGACVSPGHTTHTNTHTNLRFSSVRMRKKSLPWYMFA